ncbi:MAG TPA: TAT-variant-translocated molybdopterin oxidoreductase [Chitinophagaceae bacterium]|nr:TAT-variant-translocated molybdopterin oxidoreductase [Chitinophagaceae bacterium]
MDQKKYWQSFAERTGSEELEKASKDEFKEDLVVEDANGKGLLDATAPRRDFLKYLGFSTAAAALAASCEIPVRKAIPYVNKPENLIPGMADYYATTYVSGGDAIPVLAKVRDGRPIKIEPNELSPIFKNGSTPQVQASVLDLYDTARLRYPQQKAGNAFKEVSSFSAMDKLVTDALNGLGGAPIIVLTATITSPTTLQAFNEFKAKFPGARLVQYDGISYSGMLTANEASYGRRAIPSYNFDKAQVIVSLGADFLGTWLAPVEFQNGYSKNRIINEANPQMSKHIQFESMMSMTGANADDRYTHLPSQTGAVALALLNAINGSVARPSLDAKLQAGVDKAAQALKASNGAALVVCGSNNPNVQIIVNAINDAIGAIGTTINWSVINNTRQGVDSEFAQLLTEMEGGSIGALIVHDANPAYHHFDAERFKKALAKVRVTVSCNTSMDETTELCQFLVPAHHYLESWGDAEPRTGFYSLLQPAIAPLFKTRSFTESLLRWSGNAATHDAYVKQYWVGRMGSEDSYYKALQDGVFTLATTAAAGTTAGTAGGAGGVTPSVTAAAAKLGTPASGKPELVLYQNVAMGDGRHPNNPMLLELPDPITRACWDNYVMMSPAMAKELLKIDIASERQANDYEFFPDKPVVRVTAPNKAPVELPVLIIPGMHNNTIAISVGYGRSEKLGLAVPNVGKNVNHLASFVENNVDWVVPNVTIEKTGTKYKLAQTQVHGSYEGRHEVVRELTLAHLRQVPDEILKERQKELEPWGGLENYESQGTLYPVFEKPGIKWGMSIDLNACFGCGACVVACHVENNVPVVGKTEVMRSHDMHWLRIDRYFTGNPHDPESIQAIFQPMLCQHCDNAPCENVCPVAATPHSTEGLNMMTYNRCIGTRYCANNCPYKVRRFNWADYLGSDSFKNNQTSAAYLDPVVNMMNDDLSRMVLNPDVTVRSRGVMEKCTFCVQRLQDAKLQAKKENRRLYTGNLDTSGQEKWDVKTACQQACSAGAIVFGNANDTQSAVSIHRASNNKRLFYVLEPLHTLPNISYLPKIRNTERLSGAHEVAPKSGQLPASTTHESEAH